MPNIGVFLSANVNLAFADAVEMASSLGVAGVQLWNVGGELDPATLDAEGRARIHELAGQHGLTISALCGHTDLVDPDGLDARVAALLRVIDLSVDLGAPLVTTESGPATGDSKRDWATLVAAFRRICAYADDVGADVAIEPAGTYGLVSNSDEILRLIANVGSDRLKVNLDPANILDGGDDPADAVEVLAPWIVHTHAKDGITNPWRERTLGQGSVPWSRYVTALRDIGYDGYFTVEREMLPDPVRDFQVATGFLEDILGEVYGGRLHG